MSWDPMGVVEAEAEDERHWRRFTQVPLIDLGFRSEPRYIPAGCVFKGQPAQWWIETVVGRDHGLLVPADSYTPNKTAEEK